MAFVVVVAFAAAWLLLFVGFTLGRAYGERSVRNSFLYALSLRYPRRRRAGDPYRGPCS